ncbi:hypothetical protein [Parapedobacter lycopersici]|uniref:hypothetical protein n=1 Tax=Parapedobacter lycopersici TaxID=1864939 RepID=UPI00214D4372|nr:hypothetical protein [Parapedobacter lycopersici]
MEKQLENHGVEVKNVNSTFYLLGILFGGITGGYIQETVLGAVIGIVIGLIFSAFFVRVLLNGRSHDR